MGALLKFREHFRDEKLERRKLLAAAEALKDVISRTPEPKLRAMFQAHLSQYLARLATVEDSELKTKRAA
jgi:hypothetical protein